ncbi:membrane protein [Flavobacterium psychrophilum]|nr:membrane protein [Flavobacterium psychrophilum]
MEKEKVIPEFFNTNISIWIAAFFIIFLASSEIMLHGLVITNSPVTLQDIKSSTMYADYKNDPKYLRILISDNFISETRTRIWKAAFPILWGFLAFIFLIIGIKKQNKTIRIIALSLLGLTVVKLFVYDISNVSETGKIIAFILLGVLILIISFVYQKLKILVIDDTKTEEHKEINKINENE